MALPKNLRRFATTVICVTLIGGLYSSAPQEAVTKEKIGILRAEVAAAAEPAVTVGTINCDVLNVRLDAGTENRTLGKVYAGNTVAITDFKDGWFYVTDGAITGWICGEYVTDIKEISPEEYNQQKKEVSDIAASAAAYVKQFVGKPYARGAVGPNSFDCSGLVRYVYGAYGVSVPHSSKSIANMGQAVALSDIRPGDIMCFATGGGGVSHVGIYVGNNQLVHASTGRRGVTYDGIYDTYYQKTLVKIVRIA